MVAGKEPEISAAPNQIIMTQHELGRVRWGAPQHFAVNGMWMIMRAGQRQRVWCGGIAVQRGGIEGARQGSPGQSRRGRRVRQGEHAALAPVLIA